MDGGRAAPAAPGRLRPRRDHQPVRRRARLVQRGVRRRRARAPRRRARPGRRVHRRLVPLSAPRRRRRSGVSPGLRLPQAAARPGDARGGLARPRSGALGRRRRSVERHRRWPAPSAPPGCWSKPAPAPARRCGRSTACAPMPSFPASPRRRAGSSGSVDEHARHLRRPRPESGSRSPARRDRSLRPLPRRGDRRLRRRRVRLRPRGADLARGAGPDPRVRQDRHRARRRRQRRQQRRRARREDARGRPARRRRHRRSAARRAARRRRRPGAGPRPRPRDADQDAHPRRRHPLRQAADRPHGSRHAPPRLRRRAAPLRAGRARRDRLDRRRARLGLRRRPGDAAAGGRDQASGADAEGRAAADPRRLALRPGPLPRPDRVDAERSRGRGADRRADRRRRPRARAGRPPAARGHADGRGADHARQPRHGAVRAGRADAPHPDLTAPTRSPTSPAPATR